MSRYRPAEKPGSQFITPAGAQRLKEELDQLWRVERPRVTQAVAEAAAQGDRSENAEYTYGKRRLREIDRRVRFLRKRLEGMTVVDRAAGDPKRVFFGAWVDARGRATAAARALSHRRTRRVRHGRGLHQHGLAARARACCGKALDEEFSVELPGGQHASSRSSRSDYEASPAPERTRSSDARARS